MSKIEEVKKILDEPVTCEDGRSHYIDENNKRYLAYLICQLEPKPFDEKFERRLKQIYSDEPKPNQGIACPFCGEIDFDKVGLKYHLNNYCKVYKEAKDVY